MAGTAWNVFVAHGLGSADRMNENFDWIEGHLLPQAAGVGQNNLYKLGTSTYKWRTGYFGTSLFVHGNTLSGFDNSTLEVSAGLVRAKANGSRGSTGNAGTQREVLQGTISYPDLRANAVTTYAAAGAGSQATGTVITSAGFTTVGGPVLVIAHAQISFTSDAGGAADIDVTVDRNGTAITGGKTNLSVAETATQGYVFNAMVMCVDTPSAGAVTYKLRYTQNSGTVTFTSQYQLTFIELRA